MLLCKSLAAAVPSAHCDIALAKTQSCSLTVMMENERILWSAEGMSLASAPLSGGLALGILRAERIHCERQCH